MGEADANAAALLVASAMDGVSAHIDGRWQPPKVATVLAQAPEHQDLNTAAAGWELFIETRLEVDEESAFQLDFLWSKYTYGCADRGFPVFTETSTCAWLSKRGLIVKAAAYGLPSTEQGIQVIDSISEISTRARAGQAT